MNVNKRNIFIYLYFIKFKEKKIIHCSKHKIKYRNQNIFNTGIYHLLKGYKNNFLF